MNQDAALVVKETRRGGWQRAWPWLLLVAALGLWAITGTGGAGLPDGEPAPALEMLWTEGGAPFALEAHRGHVVVLAFWATWCPSCRTEGPILSRVATRIAPSGDRVVGASIDEAPLEDIHRAAMRLGMTYPIALASQDDLARFGVERLPTVYVIAPDGRVAASFTGSATERAILAAVQSAR